KACRARLTSASSFLEILTFVAYLFLSNSARTLRPVSVVVLAINSTIVRKVRNGLPLQFIFMKANRRCSTLFHLLVPGGIWQTVIGSLSSLANFCSSIFHNRTRHPLLPPASAVINRRLALGYRFFPITFHHRRIALIAKHAVS